MGTENGRLYTQQAGVLVDEKTFIARRSVNGEVVCTGNEAFALQGKVGPETSVIACFEKGLISHEGALCALLESYREHLPPLPGILLRPNAIVVVPVLCDPVHLSALTRAFSRAG